MKYTAAITTPAMPVARKVTPDIVRGIHRLTLERRTKKQMSQELGISEDVIKRVRSGRYPSLDSETLTVWRELFDPEYAATSPNPPGISDSGEDPAPTATDWALLRPKAGWSDVTPKRATPPSKNKLAPSSSYLDEAAPEVPAETETTKEDHMLLVSEGLRPETRRHFNLARNPFVDDIQSPADVFQTPSVRYVRAALTDCAQHHGFIAVVGESGAGKSTLAEDLEERIRTENKNILIIRPYVLV